MSKKHMGSSVEDFLKDEGILEEARLQAIKETVAWQLAGAMKSQKVSKKKMAALLKTSRGHGGAPPHDRAALGGRAPDRRVLG